ncbi:DNA polymerase III subunit alpha [Mycoplasmoides alvi]|uniref:DNA polymerase III subunit alpha n=1 Tax=Mycoplasmoides alvi TaxID=78580 RepID=UPI000695DA9D|nr:DNA polymerase III subunit alpha [Mycoplasmoides alvi]
MFVNLNVKSYYSILSSILSIEDIISFAINTNQKYVVLTDFNVLYGAVDFFDLAKKNNLIPVIGLEIFHESSLSNLVLFAKSNIGYKNLLKISSFIMCKTFFDLDNYLEDVAIVIKEGNYLPKKKDVEYYIANSECEKGIAFNEVTCFNKEDAYLINVLNAIKNEYIFNSFDEIYMSPKGNSFLTEQEAKKVYSDNQIENINNLLHGINWDLNEFHTTLIEYPVQKNISSRIYLQTLCKEGLKKRFKNKNNIPIEYINRLKYELDIINSMGFNDYFLVVYDFINWAKKENIIIGPGRGSAVGSLVSYSLFITDIDPLEFKLIFERFLNPERKTMPDIDVDIMDSRRDEVIDYIFNKYKDNHAAHIITFQKIKAKMAIRDAGRILKIDLKEIDIISKLIDAKYDEELELAIIENDKLKQKAKEYPKLFEIAKKLIGLPRQIGTHAAGIILSNVELTNIIPIQIGLNNHFTSQFSMDHLERFGLIKIDLLGLRNLTILDNIIKLIKLNKNKFISLLDIPRDDEKTFKLFCNKQTNGIFQFESHGMKNVLKMLQPKSIEDLSLVSSLYRPGPQDNISTFIKRKNNEEETTFISNKLIPFLKDTYGIIVYQEQVIEIVKVVANFTLAEADMFRRAISKKDENQLSKLKSKFIASAINNNFSKKAAEEIYSYIFNFANYGFNHSHAVAYSLLGYWIAYFKAHYPLEFYVTLLKGNSNDDKKINLYVKEAIDKNIEFISPDINLSKETFYAIDQKIIMGFDLIKGIGNETIKKIIKARSNMLKERFDSFAIAVRELHSNKVGKAAIENLIYAGSFDNFGFNRKTMIMNLPMLLSLSLFGKNVDNSEYNINLYEMNKNEQKEYSLHQQKILAINLQENPISFLKKKFRISSNGSLDEIIESKDGFYKVLVKFSNVSIKTDKKNKNMAFIAIEDETSHILRMVVWSALYEKYKNFLIRDNICLILIKIDPKGCYLVKMLEVYDDNKQEFLKIS